MYKLFKKYNILFFSLSLIIYSIYIFINNNKYTYDYGIINKIKCSDDYYNKKCNSKIEYKGKLYDISYYNNRTMVRTRLYFNFNVDKIGDTKYIYYEKNNLEKIYISNVLAYYISKCPLFYIIFITLFNLLIYPYL